MFLPRTKTAILSVITDKIQNFRNNFRYEWNIFSKLLQRQAFAFDGHRDRSKKLRYPYRWLLRRAVLWFYENGFGYTAALAVSAHFVSSTLNSSLILIRAMQATGIQTDEIQCRNSHSHKHGGHIHRHIKSSNESIHATAEDLERRARGGSACCTPCVLDHSSKTTISAFGICSYAPLNQYFLLYWAFQPCNRYTHFDFCSSPKHLISYRKVLADIRFNDYN